MDLAARLASFLQSLHLDLAEEQFGSFRLEDDLALGVAGFGAGVDHLAVEDVGDLVAIADAFEDVPLAGRFFDVIPFQSKFGQQSGLVTQIARPVLACRCRKQE